MEQSKRGSGRNSEEVKERHIDKRGTSEDSQPKARTLRLDDWQLDALENEGNLLLCTGRQVGKTTIMSIKAAEYLVKHPNSRIIVCSLTEDQAQLMIVMVLDYLQRNYKSYIAKGKKAPTKSSVTLNNKSKVIARPVGNTGDAVRGFTGDILILDEASRFNDFIFQAAKPTLLTTGGKIWICSTPFGKSGYFYECFLNKHERFKVIHTNSWNVVNTRPISEAWTIQQKTLAIEFLNQEKKDMSELQFSQEYLGMFVDDLRQLFSDKIINHTCTEIRPPTIRPHREYYCGIDIARLGADEGTYEVLEKVDLGDNEKRLIQVENIVTKKQLTTQTFDRIIQLNKQYDFRKIGIDAGAGALGVTILDFLLREDDVKRKVEALNNRQIPLDRDGKRKRGLLKEDMYLNLLALMETRRIKLLKDEDLILSLRSVQYEYITTGY